MWNKKHSCPDSFKKINKSSLDLLKPPWGKHLRRNFLRSGYVQGQDHFHMFCKRHLRDAASLFSELLVISILEHNTQSLLCCFPQTVYTGKKAKSPLATQIQLPQCYGGEAKPHELIRQIEGRTAGVRETRRAKVRLHFLVLMWLDLKQCAVLRSTLELCWYRTEERKGDPERESGWSRMRD